MNIPAEIQATIPFTYASDVLCGKVIVGKRIAQAVDRFYNLIEVADTKGYWLDYRKGFAVIVFLKNC
jgi:hypothetical protein